MTLDCLQKGQKARIKAVNITEQNVKKRLLDIGFNNGAIVEMYKKNPSKNDMSIVIVYGTKYAMRNSLLKKIEVEPLNLKLQEEETL